MKKITSLNMVIITSITLITALSISPTSLSENNDLSNDSITTLYQANAQENLFADHVIINEVETNPPGNDYSTISEWVELYNPTDIQVDISNWQVASTTISKKTFTLPQGTIIEPNSLLVFSYTQGWFADSNERVELRDNTGAVIDLTPPLSDTLNDFKSWQRVYDGQDTNSISDWKYSQSTAGLSNGKIDSIIDESTVSLSLKSDKSEYTFEQTAIITGNVSEKIYNEKPFYHPEAIVVAISGPEYFKETLLYPDISLGYKTSLVLKKLFGINAGVYTVTATYSGVTQTTQFTIHDEIKTISTDDIVGNLTITTDRFSYLPGQFVKLSAKTSKIIPNEGLEFKIFGPGKIEIHDGTLFPDLRGNTKNTPSTPQFSTEIFLNPLNPVFGTFEIVANYGEQRATSTFNLLEDIKDEDPISLSSDKTVYELGETVTINGRLNHVWIPTIDLQIKQISTDHTSSTQNLIVSKTVSLMVQSDGRFSYDLQIGTSNSFIGEYIAKASKDIGSAEINFRIVSDVQEHEEDSDDSVVIRLDKTIYELGDTIIISGRITEKYQSSQLHANPITFTFFNADSGGLIKSTTNPESNEESEVALSVTAVPDRAGSFHVTSTLEKSFYPEGNYIIRASLANGARIATIPFSIIDSDKTDDDFTITINKDVFGFGETVQVDGYLPSLPQGSSIVIQLIKPGGDLDEFGLLADELRFSWSWQTPIQEITQNIKKSDGRVAKTTNMGVYQINVLTNVGEATLFFKLSSTPDTDSLSTDVLSISTDKTTYAAGEELVLSGRAQEREQGTEGLNVPERVKITVETTTFPIKQIYESFVYLGRGGYYENTFDLPVSIFKEGTYKVKAQYQHHRTAITFDITNDYVVGGDQDLELITSLDKQEYYPGDTVYITGRFSKLVSVPHVEIIIIAEDNFEITCGSFICGMSKETIRVTPTPSGHFAGEYKIDISNDTLGRYEVITQTEFDQDSSSFVVVQRPPPVKDNDSGKITNIGDDTTSSPITNTPQLRLTEKFNRITDEQISILLSSTTHNESSTVLDPRVIQGSLVTTRGQESMSNLQVIAPNGQCVIGPQEECAVKESTRSPRAIYKIVNVDNIDYNVRYSGSDVRLEKFTVLPVDSDKTLDHLTWKINVLKDNDDLRTRFYYKIVYVDN